MSMSLYKSSALRRWDDDAQRDDERRQRGGKPHWRKVQRGTLRRSEAERYEGPCLPLDDMITEVDHWIADTGLGWRRDLADALHCDGFVCGWHDVDVVDRFGYEPQDLPADLGAEFYAGRRAGEELRGAVLPDSVRAALRTVAGPR